MGAALRRPLSFGPDAVVTFRRATKSPGQPMQQQHGRITREALVSYLLTLTVAREDGSTLTPKEMRAAIDKAFTRRCAEATAERIRKAAAS